MPKVLFRPADVLATADALRAMEFNEVTPQRLLGRHMCGDWGELPARERRKNELRAMIEDGKVTSRFRLDSGEIVEVTLPRSRTRAQLHHLDGYYDLRNHIVDFLVSRAKAR